MKSRRLLLSVGISFVVPVIVIVGCIAEQDTYPNGQRRPPGGIGPSPSVVGAKCGDNKVDTGESCDDGNEANGDGCGSTCQVEACWGCSSGACATLALNTPCNGTQVCDGKGNCGDCVPADIACDKCQNCASSACDEANDCASTACVTGICRSASGSACIDPVECASNHCSGGSLLGLCASCTEGSQCKSGSCDLATGKCLGAMGEPCDGSVTCASGLQCSAINICQGIPGAPCTANQQCASNYCLMGFGCINCTEGKECFTGSFCTNGVCSPIKLPIGAYCVNSANCESNSCDGFPRRCAAP